MIIVQCQRPGKDGAQLLWSVVVCLADDVCGVRSTVRISASPMSLCFDINLHSLRVPPHRQSLQMARQVEGLALSLCVPLTSRISTKFRSICFLPQLELHSELEEL
jgi:hypothetical protein